MMMMRRQKKWNKLNLRKSFQAHQRWQPDAVVWPALTLYTTRKSTTQFDVYQINTHRFLDFMLSGAQMQMQSDSQRVVRQTVMAKWRRQWRLRLRLRWRWQWRWQRCECSTTTAAAAFAVVLSHRHLPHDVAPETRRRRHEVPTMWMKQLAKQNAEKCYGNGNCMGVGVGVCVGVGGLLLGKRYQECVQHWGITGWYMAVMAVFLFLPFPPVYGKMLRRKKNL